MTSEFEPTTERWQLGVEEDNPYNGIRVVDCQDVTIATIWKQPHDSDRWAPSNAQLFVAAKDLLEAAKALRIAAIDTGLTQPQEDDNQDVQLVDAVLAVERAIARAEIGD